MLTEVDLAPRSGDLIQQPKLLRALQGGGALGEQAADGVLLGQIELPIHRVTVPQGMGERLVRSDPVRQLRRQIDRLVELIRRGLVVVHHLQVREEHSR
jgi:hypothetical protein